MNVLLWFEADGYEWKRDLLLTPNDTEHQVTLKGGPKKIILETAVGAHELQNPTKQDRAAPNCSFTGQVKLSERHNVLVFRVIRV